MLGAQRSAVRPLEPYCSCRPHILENYTTNRGKAYLYSESNFQMIWCMKEGLAWMIRHLLAWARDEGAIEEVFLNEGYEKRNIFIWRYWYFDSIESICKRKGFSQSKVKSIVYELKLRKYLESEGIEIWKLNKKPLNSKRLASHWSYRILGKANMLWNMITITINIMFITLPFVKQ